MGTEANEGVVKEMQSILGFGKEEEANSETKTTNEDDTSSTSDIEEENITDATVKEDNPQETTLKTTSVTDEQMNINQEIAVIDSQIEALSKQSVDTDTFYDNIEEHLSEEEQALEISNKPAYMKLVSLKVKEFEEANSKTSAIKELEDKKSEMKLVYDRQSAILEVSAKYPKYEHEKMISYFENDLSKAEQSKIFDGATSYADVYERTYQKFQQSNPSNIKEAAAPKIPDVNNIRKESVKTSQVENGFKGDDEQLQEALGL